MNFQGTCNGRWFGVNVHLGLFEKMVPLGAPNPMDYHHLPCSMLFRDVWGNTSNFTAKQNVSMGKSVHISVNLHSIFIQSSSYWSYWAWVHSQETADALILKTSLLQKKKLDMALKIIFQKIWFHPRFHQGFHQGFQQLNGARRWARTLVTSRRASNGWTRHAPGPRGSSWKDHMMGCSHL